MTTQQIQLVLNLGILIGTVIAFIYFVGKAKLKESGKYNEYMKAKIHKQYVKLYNSIIFRNSFRRVVNGYASLCCFSTEELREISVKSYKKALLISLGFPVLILLLLKDVMITLVTILLGMIYYNMTINKAIDKVQITMLRQASNSIQSIRENFMQTENIAQAVLLCEKGKLVETPLLTIYDLLTDVDGTELLDEFCRKSPLRILMSLAMSCYIVLESGDEKKEDGSSTFSDTLIALRQEADAEVRRLKKTELAFKSLNSLALVGIIGMPFAELFNLTQIPGTSVLLKGMYGLVSKTVIILSTILVYYVISVLVRPSVVNQVDMSEKVYVLSRNKKWNNRVLSNIIPRQYKRRMKLNILIQDSISSKTMEYIYTAKIVYSTLVTTSILILLVVFTLTAKSYVYNNTGSLGFIPAQPMEEKVYNRLVKLDKEFLDLEIMPTKDEAAAMVKGSISGLSELQRLEQADRLIKKYETYHGLEFKWYFVLIAYLCGVATWFGPELSLMLRKKLVEYEAEEDVLQLQTLMIVIANTKLDVFKVLYWLQKQSTVHKAPIRFAYQEYTSNPISALQRLQASVGNLELKRMVSKLESAVYKLSIHDAFSDIYLNKEQALRMREMMQQESLDSKKEWAKLLCMVPGGLMIMLIFIGPILLLGINEMLKMFATLGGM